MLNVDNAEYTEILGIKTYNISSIIKEKKRAVKQNFYKLTLYFCI